MLRALYTAERTRLCRFHPATRLRDSSRFTLDSLFDPRRSILYALFPTRGDFQEKRKTSFHGERGFSLLPNPHPFSRKAKYLAAPLSRHNLNDNAVIEKKYYLLRIGIEHNFQTIYYNSTHSRLFKLAEEKNSEVISLFPCSPLAIDYWYAILC